MANVSTAVCSDFQAAQGDYVTFTGIPGTCTISAIPSQTWPFVNPSPINFPLPANVRVQIASGLTVGDSYPYNVSCCMTDSSTHTVTITG